MVQLRSLAAERQQFLSSLIQTNSGEVLRVAIPERIVHVHVHGNPTRVMRQIAEYNLRLRTEGVSLGQPWMITSRLHASVVVAILAFCRLAALAQSLTQGSPSAYIARSAGSKVDKNRFTGVATPFALVRSAALLCKD